MTTALLYFATAAAAAWLASRYVRRLSPLAALALILLPLCFTGRALLTGKVYAPIEMPFAHEPLAAIGKHLGVPPVQNHSLSDVHSLNIPWKYAARRAYERGEWALWNPYNFAGDILGGNAQPTQFEPVTLLSYLLPPANSFTFLAAMTFFLGALAMFLFLRELDCIESTAILGGAAWTFSLFMTFWVMWVIAPTVIWLPLVLLGVRRIIHAGTRGFGILLTAFTMMMLNGHPESGLHIVTVGLVWAAGELWLVRGRGFLRSAILGGGAGIVTLLLCAIYLLPLLEAIPQTMEHSHRECCYSQSDKSPEWDVVRQHLLFHIVPFRFGDPSAGTGNWPRGTPIPFADAGYPGGVILVLAAAGLFVSKRSEKWMALAFLLIGILIGSAVPPFIDLLGKAPLFDIALNGRLIFAEVFACCVLAALACDAVERDASRSRVAGVIALIASAGLLAAVAMSWRAMIEWPVTRDFLVERTVLLLVPSFIVALLFFTRGTRRVVPIAIALLLVQRTGESSRFVPVNQAEHFYPPIPILDSLAKTEEPYRITGHGHMFLPNVGTMYEVEDVRGYSAMTFLRFRDVQDLWSVHQPVWWNRVVDLNRPFLSALNVRYALMSDYQPIPDGWRKVAHTPGTYLLENPKVLPRVYVPRRVVEANTLDYDVMNVEADFGERSWIELPNATRTEKENAIGSAVTRRRGMSGFDIRATLDREGWLVVSQTAWKGWKAKVDGRPAPLVFANHALLGIRVPAGEHHIQLVYQPRGFVVGRAITFGTILLLIAGSLYLRVRKTHAEARS